MKLSVALVLATVLCQCNIAISFITSPSSSKTCTRLEAVSRPKPGKIVVRRNTDKIAPKPLPPPPKLITFDAEGTLLQLSAPIGLQLRETLLKFNKYTVRLPGPAAFEEAYNNAYKAGNELQPCYGLSTGEPSHQWWYDIIYKSLADTCEAYMIPPDEVVDPIMEPLFDELYYETFTGLEAWELRPDVLRTLDRLADWRDAGGALLGVISNSDERLSTILDNLGILDHFDFVFSSREMGSELPDTSMLDIALRKAGLFIPSEAMHCGDSLENDIGGATKAGWRSCYIKKPPFPRGSQAYNLMNISALLPLIGLPPLSGPIKTTRRRGQFVEESE